MRPADEWRVYHNPCGGQRWRTLRDWRIEVEGRGLPTASPSASDYYQLELSWKHWGGIVRRAAARHGVPASYLIALMAVETGLWARDPERQASLTSSAGARGLMQIMPGNARMFGGYDKAELFEPRVNVDVGARIVSRFMDDGHDLPALSALYNSGGLCSPGRNRYNLRTASVGGVSYVDHAIAWNNAAVTDLGANASWLVPVALGAVVGVGAVGGALWAYRRFAA